MVQGENYKVTFNNLQNWNVQNNNNSNSSLLKNFDNDIISDIRRQRLQHLKSRSTILVIHSLLIYGNYHKTIKLQIILFYVWGTENVNVMNKIKQSYVCFKCLIYETVPSPC